MSEEIMTAMADIAYWRRRAEQAETSRDGWRDKAHAALDQLRQAKDELQATRAIVELVRAHWRDEPALDAAVAAYDEATKARVT